MSEYKPYSPSGPTAPPYGGSQGYGTQGYSSGPYGKQQSNSSSNDPYGRQQGISSSNDPYGRQQGISSSNDPYGRQQGISSSNDPYGRQQSISSSNDPYGRHQSTAYAPQYGIQLSSASPMQYGNPTPGSNYSSYGQYQQQPQGYGATAYPSPASPYGAPPSSSSMFPPNTDNAIVQIFQQADVDRSGTIDAKELGRLLSEGRVAFSDRTIRLMLHLFADNPNDPARIGPAGFVNLWRELGIWHEKFMEYDRDRSGTIDVQELQQVLLSFHFAIPPSVLAMLVKKYDHSGFNRSIGYGQFIECGFIVKGLTEKFRDQDRTRVGSATFDYTSFMLMVIPFIAA